MLASAKYVYFDINTEPHQMTKIFEEPHCTVTKRNDLMQTIIPLVLYARHTHTHIDMHTQTHTKTYSSNC